MNIVFQIYLYYAESGGIINLLLFVVCFIVVYLGSGKVLQIRKNKRAADKWRTAVKNNSVPSIPSGTIYGAMSAKGLGTAGSNLSFSGKYYRNVFQEILLKYVPELERGFDTIAVCIAAAPLLGLLGTVAGMMKTFRIIMEFGVGNPGLLSQGISMALVTTQAGLIVAFPCLLFHNYLCNRKEELIKRALADGEAVISMKNGGDVNA